MKTNHFFIAFLICRGSPQKMSGGSDGRALSKLKTKVEKKMKTKKKIEAKSSYGLRPRRIENLVA